MREVSKNLEDTRERKDLRVAQILIGYRLAERRLRAYAMTARAIACNVSVTASRFRKRLAPDDGPEMSLFG